jgi:hypothetical protein
MPPDHRTRATHFQPSRPVPAVYRGGEAHPLGGGPHLHLRCKCRGRAQRGGDMPQIMLNSVYYGKPKLISDGRSCVVSDCYKAHSEIG